MMVFLVFTSCSAHCLSLQNIGRNTLKTQYKNHILIILSNIIVYLHNYNAGNYAIYFSAVKVNRLTRYM